MFPGRQLAAIFFRVRSRDEFEKAGGRGGWGRSGSLAEAINDFSSGIEKTAGVPLIAIIICFISLLVLLVMCVVLASMRAAGRRAFNEHMSIVFELERERREAAEADKARDASAKLQQIMAGG